MYISIKFGPFSKPFESTWSTQNNLKSSSRVKNLKHLGIILVPLQKSIYLRKLDKEIMFVTEWGKVTWHLICPPEITKIMKTMKTLVVDAQE